MPRRPAMIADALFPVAVLSFLLGLAIGGVQVLGLFLFDVQPPWSPWKGWLFLAVGVAGFAGIIVMGPMGIGGMS